MNTPRFREGQRIQLGTHDLQIRRLRRWLTLTMLLAALGAAGGAVGFLSARGAVNDNCKRIHRIVQVGGELIGSPKELRQMRASGRITEKQLQKALGWYRADCPPPPEKRL